MKQILIKNNIRLRTIGDIDRLADDVRERLFETIKLTSGCTGLNLDCCTQLQFTLGDHRSSQKNFS